MMNKANNLSLNAFTGFLSRNSAVAALIVIFAYGMIALPNFLTETNLSAILSQYSIIGFLAIGQLLVILTGGIDLSQGSQVAFTSIVTAVLMQSYGPVAAVLGGIIATTFLGLISGVLVSRTAMPPFIVTLGMLGIARGLAMFIANAKPVPISVASFNEFGKSALFGIPVSAFLWIAACLILFWFLTRRRFGRYIYAVGSSEESSRLSGIDVKSVKLLTYVVCSFLTAVAGVIWTSRLNSGSPIGGNGYEMESIAAVVVGGGSLFGGEGSVSGTVAGVLLFGVINSILNLTGISPFWQGTIKGILVLMAVALSQIRRPGQSNL